MFRRALFAILVAVYAALAMPALAHFKHGLPPSVPAPAGCTAYAGDGGCALSKYNLPGGATPSFQDANWAKTTAQSGQLPGGTIQGSISGTTLTVSSVTVGVVLAGEIVSGPGVTAGTVISSGSGSSWTVDRASSATGTITITLNPSAAQIATRNGLLHEANTNLPYEDYPIGPDLTTLAAIPAAGTTIDDLGACKVYDTGAPYINALFTPSSGPSAGSAPYVLCQGTSAMVAAHGATTTVSTISGYDFTNHGAGHNTTCVEVKIVGISGAIGGIQYRFKNFYIGAPAVAAQNNGSTCWAGTAGATASLISSPSSSGVSPAFVGFYNWAADGGYDQVFDPSPPTCTCSIALTSGSNYSSGTATAGTIPTAGEILSDGGAHLISGIAVYSTTVTPSLVSGGSGYAVNNILTFSNGESLKATAVDGVTGAVTSWSVTATATTATTATLTASGGAGTGAQFAFASTFTTGVSNGSAVASETMTLDRTNQFGRLNFFLDQRPNITAAAYLPYANTLSPLTGYFPGLYMGYGVAHNFGHIPVFGSSGTLAGGHYTCTDNGAISTTCDFLGNENGLKYDAFYDFCLTAQTMCHAEILENTGAFSIREADYTNDIGSFEPIGPNSYAAMNVWHYVSSGNWNNAQINHMIIQGGAYVSNRSNCANAGPYSPSNPCSGTGNGGGGSNGASLTQYGSGLFTFADTNSVGTAVIHNVVMDGTGNFNCAANLVNSYTSGMQSSATGNVLTITTPASNYTPMNGTSNSSSAGTVMWPGMVLHDATDGTWVDTTIAGFGTLSNFGSKNNTSSCVPGTNGGCGTIILTVGGITTSANPVWNTWSPITSMDGGGTGVNTNWSIGGAWPQSARTWNVQFTMPSVASPPCP